MKKLLCLFLLLIGFVRSAVGESPAEAVVLAAADLASLPPEARSQQHYIWIHNWTSDDETPARAVVAVLNHISRNEVVVQPEILYGGRMVRVDLLAMAPGVENYVAFRQLWESLIDSEPYFYARPQVLKLKEGEVVEIETNVSTDPAFQQLTGVGTGATLANTQSVFAPHILLHAAEAAQALTVMSSSVFPISRADWWVKTSFSTLNGGRYYDFLGITNSTTQEDYLASRGYSVAESRKRFANERIAKIRSGITGKERWIEFIRSNSTRLSASATAMGAITHDVFDEDVDPQFSIFRNLLEAKDRGQEIIIERNNGFLEFSLWAGGHAVKAAPPNLATDHLIPDQHTKQLISAVGCIRCHGPHDGWQPAENDIHKMRGTDGFDIFGDLTQPDPSDTIRRLAGMYSGNLDHAFFLARTSYGQAVIRATGLKSSIASAQIAKLHDDHLYNFIDAEAACLELGIWVENDNAQETLILALGKQNPEDPMIRLLMTVGLNRSQFDIVFTDMAIRVAPFIAHQREVKKAADTAPPPGGPAFALDP